MRNICGVFSVPPRRSWRAVGKAMDPSLDGRLVVDLSVPESMGGSPYRDATRGNIHVAHSADGVLLPSQHSGRAAGRGEPA